ncbi:hypothetical protein DFH07DRAFT_735102 [Mycena maculata]|uniref:Uncharacterized protein n=1 Tax=Mycena maculata TaxID=230809 RepID=A0AAD7NQH9_9AGAR|nr:hypothetical protein DFH07DRAFT_735102 [Mycena maculata]
MGISPRFCPPAVADIVFDSATMSRPSISSPLAGQSYAPGPAARATPQRTYSFPTSRALRPFPNTAAAAAPAPKPVKMIQPPANQRESFVLNLTQAEFSRQ